MKVMYLNGKLLHSQIGGKSCFGDNYIVKIHELVSGCRSEHVVLSCVCYGCCVAWFMGLCGSGLLFGWGER